MKPIVRFKSDDMNHLRAHLFGGGPRGLDERAAFAYAVEVSDEREPVLLVQDLKLINPEECSFVGPGSVTLMDEVKVEAIMQARRRGTRLIEIHSHPGPRAADATGFSRVDREGQIQFDRYLSWKHPGTWAALVFGERCVAGSMWRTHDQPPLPINHVMVDGRPLKSSALSAISIDKERFDRQLIAFGEAGQRALGFIRLGIVGCGGLGCFIAMYAVQLGVRRFILIDDDVVSKSNLNRMPHVTAGDIGRSKVEVLAEYIRRCSPEAEIEIIHSSVRSDTALSRLRFCDVIAGAVDNDGARSVISYIAAAFLIPYLDAASDIVMIGDAVIPGGRVHVWTASTNCLHCDGLLSDDEVREVLSTKSEREVRARLGYGGKVPLRSPSIVQVNGHVAASLVDEFHALIVGAHPIHRHREYRANRGQEVDKRTAARTEYCPCCTESLGIGDAVDLSRFVARDEGAA